MEDNLLEVLKLWILKTWELVNWTIVDWFISRPRPEDLYLVYLKSGKVLFIKRST
jgi:hypothetical protein